MRASNKAIEIIKRFEGFRSKPYKCAGGTLTVGYGDTDDAHKGAVTEAEAETLLREEVARLDAALELLIYRVLTHHQYDAVVSLVYNIGLHNFERSALRQLINRGDFESVPNEWRKWRKAKGKVLPGLVKRREAEIALWENKSKFT